MSISDSMRLSFFSPQAGHFSPWITAGFSIRELRKGWIKCFSVGFLNKRRFFSEMLEEKVTGIWARVKNKISYAAKVGAVGIGMYVASEMVAPKMASAQSVESKIAFASDRDGDDEIYIMNVDGGGVTKITNNSVGDWGPAWSPDGRKIAYTRIQDGEERIYVMNADGSNQRRITNNSNITWEAYPKWSPDGQKIAFTVDWDIFSINIDGTNQINLTNSPSRQERIPTWSPD